MRILISFEVCSLMVSDAKGESYQVSSAVRGKCFDFGARRVGESISDRSETIPVSTAIAYADVVNPWRKSFTVNDI